MRQLTDSLLAAQKKPDRLPYVEAKVYDFEQGIQRLHWTRLYEGSEPDNHHGITFDGQGSMHRIRYGGGNILYRQKITSPDPSSDYSQWTQVATDCQGACSIAAYGAKVYIFYRTTDNTIRKYYSHNYGADWTDAELSTYQDATAMAAAWWGTGNIVVCFIANGVIANGQLNAIVLDTSDQSRSEHTHSEPDNHPLLGVYGIGAAFGISPEKMCVIFAARQAASPYNFYALYRTELSSTYHWLGWQYFITAPDGEDIYYQFPDVHLPLSPQNYESFQMTAVEVFAGTSAYSRPLRFHAVRASEFSEMAYSEPKPFLNISSDHGLRITSNSDYWWMERPDGVWRATRAAGDPLDLTQDIVELNQRIPGELTIELDNHSGKYAGPGVGDITKLKKRSEVVLKLGYRTSPPTWKAATPYAKGDIIVPTAGKKTGFFCQCTTAGTSHATTEPTWPTVLGETVVDNTAVWMCHPPNESSQAGVYWIDGWEYSSTPNTSLFTLHCLDGWGLAARWAARCQFRWNETAVSPKTVWELIKALLCRCGICLVNAAARSDAITTLKPEFIVNPGQPGDAAVRRLLAMVPDLLDYQRYYPDIDYTIATTKEPRGPDHQYPDSACYEYRNAPGYHRILTGDYTHHASPITHVRAIGRDAEDVKVIASAFDWANLELAIDNFQLDYDPNLENATRAQERADAILRKNALEAQGGQITIPVNCGQELYDVITITDERCGISSQLYRVMAIQADYSRREARYTQRLTLASP